MSRKHLGDDFDIHAGGQDLLFPHHDNEIAQSACSCHGAPRVQAHTWVHVGMLRVNGEKMSKSLGNVITLDRLAHLPGAAVRLMLLRSHYRSTLDWTDTMVADTLALWYRLEAAAASLPRSGPLPAPLVAALEQDLNTPLAITHLIAMLDTQDPHLGIAMGALGLWDADPHPALDTDTVALVETVIAARNQARAAKDFATADALRTLLQQAGVQLLDRAQHTSWRPSATFTPTLLSLPQDLLP
jgi:cysteinyl-tRNA synthetase